MNIKQTFYNTAFSIAYLDVYLRFSNGGQNNVCA